MNYWESKQIISLRKDVDYLLYDSKKYKQTTNKIYLDYLQRRNLAKLETDENLKNQKLIEAKKQFESEINAV